MNLAQILDVILGLGGFALAILFCTGAWIIFGRPEHICSGCDMPESCCECEEV